MHNLVEDAAVATPRRVVPEHAPAENSAVEAAVGAEEVGRAGAKVGYYRRVASGAGLDDLAREEVGVDYGEVVGRGGEDGGDGGFAGRDGTGEAD